ncbi:hypothetical protein GH714_038363 [Hevea brasiliensis]|uniref:Uncharacterized protein n=1 Tax=Hevea brasiliensis TaxID=3981 RepID=A0A6A6KDX0_HEVBR|nr:hypothetical protein GH714_038363 [Hevea brasiliensis]
MSLERRSNSASTSPEENALFLDILNEALCGHRKRRSIFGAVVYCVLLASYAVLGAIAPLVFHHKLVPSLLCSCGVALLLVTGIFQQYFVSQVQKIRLQGYYSFSQKLKHIVRLPFAITAYGIAAMLLVVVWKPQISFLSIPALLRIIALTEAVCAVSFMSIYIGYLHQYNSLDSQPDILKSLYSPLQQSSSLEGLRYHDGGRLSDQQMALLQYQRENLHFLSEEILRLQESLSKYERSNDGNTPPVDLPHMLAAREQELRMLSAEMNQLQTELRLARSLIAERDSEIQQVRTTNNQVWWLFRAARNLIQPSVIMSILYAKIVYDLSHLPLKWFTHKLKLDVLKLERALEVERLSNLDLQRRLPTRNQSNVSPEQSEQRTA